MFRKKELLVTQILLQSLETILSATNHYLILLKGLFGSTIQLLYRCNNTNLVFCMSCATMKPKSHPTHHLWSGLWHWSQGKANTRGVVETGPQPEHN